MITTKDLRKELDAMELVIKSEPDKYKQAVLKAQILNLKLQQNIRANMVLVMNHLNIKKIEPHRTDE